MKKLLLSALLLASTVTFAQESKLSVSGSVDTYYSTNLSTGALGATGVLTDVAANGFGLGMANTVFAYEGSKSGVIADLAFGPRANAANMYGKSVLDENGDAIGGTAGAINQLYAYYNVSEKVTVTLGQFNTFYGYEVISPAANFNYSVSYLFGAGPFSHTGVKIDVAASEDFSYMLAITNPHGFASGTNDTDNYQFGAQLGFKGQYLNLAYGADAFAFNGANLATDALYIDYTGGFDLSDSLYLGINAAYSNSDDADYGYQGVALYLENAMSDTFSLGLRPEFFQETGAADAKVFALTLTGSTQLDDNLKLITELRYDSTDADNPVWESVLPGAKDTVTALTIAAVYSF
ncbi:outer membrane beta-barrel protein [Flavicella sediminum]|uniref:outer membrane beta-barrel protein n=1 Tax=Flavicella sediminum TaxID=2585141 RepID=UPI0011236424|nr:outer membrane beta-barrel protein [Flavicella sediminum]